jgi:hypothetical protein
MAAVELFAAAARPVAEQVACDPAELGGATLSRPSTETVFAGTPLANGGRMMPGHSVGQARRDTVVDLVGEIFAHLRGSW